MRARAAFVAVASFMAMFLAAPPGHSAEAGRVDNKEIADAVTAAQNAAKAHRYADALANTKRAEALLPNAPDAPPALMRQLHIMVVSYALQAKDYASVLAGIDDMFAVGEATEQYLELRDEILMGESPANLPPVSPKAR